MKKLFRNTYFNRKKNFKAFELTETYKKCLDYFSHNVASTFAKLFLPLNVYMQQRNHKHAGDTRTINLQRIVKDI